MAYSFVGFCLYIFSIKIKNALQISIILMDFYIKDIKDRSKDIKN